MKEQKLKTFRKHLDELMQNEEFARRYEEEKLILGLAIKIAEFRQNQGLTQSKLAKLSGISQQQLSKLEHGENCNIATFLKVCQALNLDVMLKSSIYA